MDLLFRNDVAGYILDAYVDLPPTNNVFDSV